MPLSFQPAKERLWDKPSSRKPSLVSPKAPPQPGSRAPRHPGRGPGENPCCLLCSGCQLSPSMGTGGTLPPCLDHWWRRSSLSGRPPRQTGHTCGFVCLQFVSRCLRPSGRQKRHRIHGKHEPGWLQTQSRWREGQVRGSLGGLSLARLAWQRMSTFISSVFFLSLVRRGADSSVPGQAGPLLSRLGCSRELTWLWGACGKMVLPSQRLLSQPCSWPVSSTGVIPWKEPPLSETENRLLCRQDPLPPA